MNVREEFKKEYNWIDKREQPMFLSVKYIQWLEKKIDALEAENPQVECPACKGKHYLDRLIKCHTCDETGTVSTVKAQEYNIKELEAGIERLEELLQLHQENDKIAGAME